MQSNQIYRNTMNVIFLGTTSNYPFSFSANNTKTEFLARGLTEQGNKVTVICGVLGEKQCATVQSGNSKYDFRYVIYPKEQNIFKTLFKNTKKIYNYLKLNYNPYDKNIVVTDLSYFPLFLIYVIVSRIAKYKIISIITEWPLSFHFKSNWKYWDSLLYVCTFGKLIDAILPISDSLIKKVTKFSKPVLKVPILADYSTDYNINKSQKIKSSYFVYCAGAGYVRIIQFIIDAYKIFLRYSNEKLLLVLYGKPEEVNRIRQIIDDDNLSENILIKTRLSNRELFSLYHNALGLLIPLDPDNEQDKYRFSQKIAEYLSSETPIITSPVGEIPVYFNKHNAFLVDLFTPEAYAEAMGYISIHKEESIIIGRQGYELGKKEFNYKIYGEKLSNFLKKI